MKVDMKRLGDSASAVLVFAISMLIVGCEQGSTAEPNTVDDTVSTNQGLRKEPSREKLLTAMEDVADSGKGFALKDATSLGRYVYHGQVNEYTACFRKEVPKLQAVNIYAVPKAENCPERLGMKVPASKFSSLVGRKVDASLSAALIAGYYPDHVKVFKVKSPDSQVAAPQSLTNWLVCTQEPKAGTAYNSSAEVRLYVAKKCP
ncbi:MULTISPECIES: hypothetical protein [unclassified Streptomyces]|uniref:hypothetical protein n=1 Tax=unclassified Streptomyces TaxID=2593676 RepID=UPI00225378DE|nr:MULTISPECIES: hypothetical protein [unclassified Streptomyces]MCX5328575.1 hypothetical protein [Streptomyces sp. NBC_00140]MCX5357985.1 hypothetical protein [Streptomyces sp. NBC_00124]